MRSRVPRPAGKILAAGITAALLSLAMAGSAGAAGPKAKLFAPSGGTPIPTSPSCTGFGPAPLEGCAEAGYQASGRDFRYAQAVITVPDHQGVAIATPPAEADPRIYVALDDSTAGNPLYARVGIRPCTSGALCSSTGWEAFVTVSYGAAPPTTPPADNITVTPVQAGDSVFVSVYLSPTGRSVHTVVTLPEGSTFNNTLPDPGAVYPRAQAVADWTAATTKPQPQPPASGKVRDAQVLEGRFTTLSGQRGTFAGPWTLNAFEGTTTGALPPSGALVVQPSYLWNDGTNFHGMFGDAFGVWRFPF
jgi:hypothetical protein